MLRPRTQFALRIAWSAALGSLCVFFVVLCVRSYWWNEMVSTTNATRVVTTLGADSGWLYAILPNSSNAGRNWTYWWVVAGTSPESVSFRVPIAALALLAAAVSVVPWVRWKYSLRTLLIVITLVTGLLAVAAYFEAW